MNTKLPYGIIMAFNIVICVLAMANLILFQEWDIPLIGFLYAAVIFVTIRLLKQKLTIGAILITLYIQIVGPIEMLLLKITPFSVLGNYYILYIDAMNDPIAYWKYFFYSVVMFLMMVFTCTVIYQCGCKMKLWVTVKPIGLGNILLRSRMGCVIALIIYAFTTYVLRTKFYLDVPGKSPSVRCAGLIVYTCQAIGVLLVYRAIQVAFKERELYLRDYMYSIFCCMVYGLPSVLLDQRAPLFRMLVVLVLYTYVLDSYRFTRFAKKNALLFVIGVISVFSLFQLLTTYIRYKGQVKVSILYVLSRLVGIGPGLIFFDYINKSGTNIYSTFGIMDYIENTLGSRSNSINKIFTHDVLGFPSTASHISSLPTFVGSLLYHGIVGVLFFSIMFAIVLVFGDILIRKSKANYGKFLGSYLLVCTVLQLMGGSIENMFELFAVPCFMTMLFLL